MSEVTNKAVFLSYASQDAAAAKRICEALRTAGVEVWFDQSELRGGDAWDAKIRKQIKECALFVPVISANTQTRLEGYFRIEWKLAAQRTHAMAEEKAFLLPVVVDGTRDAEAKVPAEFKAVQWTQATGSDDAGPLVANVLKLLGRTVPAPAPARSAGAAAPPAGASIAVLAFTNLSRDPENEYFSDGISEELLNVLAKIPGLKVAARTSAFFFKGRNVPIPEIARTLGVAHVVEGSVRKMGNRVRITAQLIDARDGFHLWSDNFDRELQDIFAVQDEIAGLIAKNLQLKLGAAPRATRTVNPEAHRLVLEGRHFWTLRTDDGFARAEQAFSRALAIDPDFAQAHSGLADVSAVRSWYASLGGGIYHRQELRHAAAEARRAYELDPSLAEVQASLGTVAYQEFRWVDAEEHFKQAFRLNPNYAVAYHWHAHLLAGQGRLDAGLAALERSIALDPLSFVTLVIYASQLNLARRYVDALAITDRALALRSAVHAPLQGSRAVAFLGLGRKEEAVAAARLVPGEQSFAMRWWSGEEALFVLHRAGAAGEAEAVLHEMQASLPLDNVAHGSLLHAVGRFDEALPYLELTSPAFFARFHFQAIWDDVREDPRFHRLLAKLGCEAEYRVGRETLAQMLKEREKEKSERSRQGLAPAGEGHLVHGPLSEITGMSQSPQKSRLMQRREFIKNVSLLGAASMVSSSLLHGATTSSPRIAELGNDHFTVWFNARNGTIGVRRSDGSMLLAGGSSGANTLAGGFSTNSPGREYAVDTSRFQDRLGSGRRMTIEAKDPRRVLDLRTVISIYDRRPAVTFEVFGENVSARDITLLSLEPVRVVSGEGGGLRLPGVAKCLTNGEMYYDAGTLHEFTDNVAPPGLSRPVKGARLANASVCPNRETISSWWNAGFFSGYDREGVVLGYLENSLGLGLILTARDAPDEVSFLAESVFAPSLTLRPGQSTGSNRFMLNVAPDPYRALEEYADAVGTAQGARPRSVVNGWCSWFYTLANVSEDEVLHNAAYAAQHLKPFGLEYIQIDEGYQRWHGDWEGNERFPHGMEWLAGRIREHGLKPGLWISPYVVSEPTELFQRHPEWLLHHPDGSLQRVGNWDDENSDAARNEKPKRYGLDITHPAAAAWLHDLFATISRRWGYEMIKIDFVAWSILAATKYHDPALSSAAVYRAGMEIMRDAAGEQCHILDCGPGATTVGLIDSMRIEADINYGYAEAAWKTYFQDPACSAAAAGKRYYFHQRTWINDADHLCMDLLARSQAEAAATIIALSGGNMISGDRLTELDPAKLEILRKVTPSTGVAAVPIDLFDTDIPTAFVQQFQRPFAAWSVVAFFNPDLTRSVARRYPLRRLRLDPAKTYLAFDFWRQRFLGEVTNELAVTVEAGGVTLLALRQSTGAPQVVSTDRHVSQGAVELEDVQWDGTKKVLSGFSTGPAASSHNVFVHLPGKHPWTWGGYVLFRDQADYSLKLVEENIVRVHVRFGHENRVPWRIEVGEYFG